MSVDISQRRICWPSPDATCLEGGCLYCNTYPFRPLAQIIKFALNAGVLPQRASGERDAWEAYRYGYDRAFHNVDTR